MINFVDYKARVDMKFLAGTDFYFGVSLVVCSVFVL